MKSSMFNRILLGSALLISTQIHAAGSDEENYPWQQPHKPSAVDRPTKENPSGRTDEPDPVVCESYLSNPDYISLAQTLSRLANSPRARNVFAEVGLDVVTTSWQDTGRYHNSSVGNNISDVRLVALAEQNGRKISMVQPIIRPSNFQDVTVDVDLDQVLIPVGNAWGAKETFSVSLKEVLSHVSDFLSWREPIGDLYVPSRDGQVLVSAQASLMPVLAGGQADFVPSIYNYQSSSSAPGTLVILVSNRGTSITVVDNQQEGLGLSQSLGQLLFHNKNGEKAPFKIESLDDVLKTAEGQARVNELSNSGQAVAGQSGVDQVLMIQVPLVVPRSRQSSGIVAFAASSAPMMATATAYSAKSSVSRGVVDVANYTLGRFDELKGHGRLKRDPNLPIRVDVVRYFAANSAEVDARTAKEIADRLAEVFKAGQNLGSLVTDVGTRRLTRNYQPWTAPWWNVTILPYLDRFPPRYRTQPWLYFNEKYGPGWIYRYGADRDLMVRALSELP